MSRMKHTLVTVLIAIFIHNIAIALDWRADAAGIDISGGEDHTLVLTKNKSVWACGPNGDPIYHSYYGVLGTGSSDTTLVQNTLVRVHDGDMNTPSEYLEAIKDIDAGWKHSLALQSYDLCDPNYMGYVWAWGNNYWGQLGVGEGTGARSTPIQVLRGEQLPADPNNPDPNLSRIVDISAGRSGEHSLAVDANGYAYAWGSNHEGQCGNGISGENQRQLVPVYVRRGEQPFDPNRPSVYLNRIIAVSAGEWHSMALEQYDPCDPNMDGRVYTCGDNDFLFGGSGVLGIGDNAADSNTPVCVLRGQQDYNEPNHIYLKHIVAISAGWDHSMALEKYAEYDSYLDWSDPCYIWPDPNHRGRVYTWGNNGQGWGEDGSQHTSNGGRLGDGTTLSSSTPVLVLRGAQPPHDPCDPYPYLSDIIAISAGEAHSMALDVNGYVYTWGDNQHGQLGNGCEDPCTTPVRVVGKDGQGYLEGIVAISAGYWHSLAIDANGTVWTWGKGQAGRLGLANKTIDCNTPHPIPVVYNTTRQTFHFAIQTAIDHANDLGDILEASPGAYYENANLRDKSLTLTGAEPADPNVVARTIIDAAYNSGDEYRFYYAVDFNNASASTVAGLTLVSPAGGAVLCEDVNSVSIVNCSILNNDWDGIYSTASSVNISGCEIRANASTAADDCSGVYCTSTSDVNIVNSVVADNHGDGITCEASTLRLTNSLVEDNAGDGVYCNQSAAAITNCTVQDNAHSGINADTDCDLMIGQTLIKGNAQTGLLVYPDCDCVLNMSIVCDSGADGITLENNNSLTLTNNWIYNNGRTHQTYRAGVWFSNNDASPALVRNNTIFGNPTYGIQVGDQQTDPNILSSIIYGNDLGDLYWQSGTFGSVNYCSLQAPRSGAGNITADPCFVDPDANDFHLDPNSLCIDAGDPAFTPDGNETDIDGEPRLVNARVDIGADEFYWSPADFDAGRFVNFIDYAMLASHWRQTDANSAYDDLFDLADNNAIDFADLLLFCDDWLWEAAWLAGPMPLMAGPTGREVLEQLPLDAPLSTVAPAEREPLVAEPPDIQAIINWLAEIWLDPDVRNTIDQQQFLEFYESLKQLQ